MVTQGRLEKLARAAVREYEALEYDKANPPRELLLAREYLRRRENELIRRRNRLLFSRLFRRIGRWLSD